MSEKVKLTQEQADEVELQKREFSKFDNIVTRRILTSDINDYHNKTFHSITVDTLIKALYIGYEVEPEFKEGDWVKVLDKLVGKIVIIDNNSIFHIDHKHISSFSGYKNFSRQNIRHATSEEIAQEKERRWWEKHNRDVWELKKGDILIFDNDERFIRVVTGHNRHSGRIVTNTKERSLTKEEIRKHHKIICFAENRKDV